MERCKLACMECPVCKLPMVVMEYHDLELDYCHRCMGVWFDRGEIDVLFRKSGLDLQESTISWNPATGAVSEAKRPCPLCSKSMEKITLESTDTVIDRCVLGEGFWFDRGELARILKSQAGGRDEAIRILTDFLGDVFNPAERNPGD